MSAIREPVLDFRNTRVREDSELWRHVSSYLSPPVPLAVRPPDPIVEYGGIPWWLTYNERDHIFSDQETVRSSVLEQGVLDAHIMKALMSRYLAACNVTEVQLRDVEKTTIKHLFSFVNEVQWQNKKPLKAPLFERCNTFLQDDQVVQQEVLTQTSSGESSVELGGEAVVNISTDESLVVDQLITFFPLKEPKKWKGVFDYFQSNAFHRALELSDITPPIKYKVCDIADSLVNAFIAAVAELLGSEREALRCISRHVYNCFGSQSMLRQRYAYLRERQGGAISLIQSK